MTFARRVPAEQPHFLLLPERYSFCTSAASPRLHDSKQLSYARYVCVRLYVLLAVSLYRSTQILRTYFFP